VSHTCSYHYDHTDASKGPTRSFQVSNHRPNLRLMPPTLLNTPHIEDVTVAIIVIAAADIEVIINIVKLEVEVPATGEA
jgi:hypothetical protein